MSVSPIRRAPVPAPGRAIAPGAPVGRPAGSPRRDGAEPAVGKPTVMAGGPSTATQPGMAELLRQLHDLLAAAPGARPTPGLPPPAYGPLPPPAYGPLPPPAYGPVPASGASAEVQAVLAATNRERARHGLSPFAGSTELDRVAHARSADMVSRRYFDHTDPDGRDPFWHMRSAGIRYMAAAENIAQGQRDAEAVVAAWMRSPGHRANILNPSLRKLGVGIQRDNRGIPTWTQLFTD